MKRASPRRSNRSVWLVALFLYCATTPARAAPDRAVIELDRAAEEQLDARATRRLVDLELRDVVVPPASDQADAALFYRVLGDEAGRVRVELWERGELHGVRVVSAADGGRHLGARRVALAAAELARLLRGRRLRARVVAERARRLEEKRREAERERTLDGPVALRSAFASELFTDGTLLFGPTLGLELGVPPFGRVDLATTWRGGQLQATSDPVEALELELGFARRTALTRTLDLDFGAGARAGLVSFSGVSEIDADPRQSESWWARAFAVVRLEPRLSRDVRLDLGLLSGLVLREVPLRTASGHAERFGGAFFGAELGLILTPPAGR